MTWRCPVCGGASARVRFDLSGHGTEAGVDATAFRPSADAFGSAVGTVVACTDCGHASLAATVDPDAVATAYAHAADPISIREEPGQVETARRALRWIERWAHPGRLLEIGCWTGSFLVAAEERGWRAKGIDPSTWAIARARDRGVAAQIAGVFDNDDLDGPFDLVVLADVIEHLQEPAAALTRVRACLSGTGYLYLTLPDASSRVARVMGRRWWSVLPMHLQYFTRSSLGRLLEDTGFEVVGMQTHPKVFTVRYYLERVGGYSRVATLLMLAAAGGLRLSDRLVGPDLRDRMAVLARPRG